MSHQLIDKIALNISQFRLFKEGENIFVGLSGGADSVALLAALIELGYHCSASHCNFHLRGDESDRDQSFCEQLCTDLGVELITADFDVHSRMVATGDSVEMACRALRFGFWKNLTAEKSPAVVALAHHLEDDIETFFLNAMRGSGVAGLKGMLPRRECFVRPMLNVTRQEILDYLSYKDLKYITDSSNLDNSFGRNKVRNIILPVINEGFPGAVASMHRTIEYLKEEYLFIADCLDMARDRYVNNDGIIDVASLLRSEKHPKFLLFSLMKESGFSMSQVMDILSLAAETDGRSFAGQIFTGRDISYVFDRGNLIPQPSAFDFCESIVDLSTPPFSMREMTAEAFREMLSQGRLDKEAIYLDSDVLCGSPLFRLRNWRVGDRFRPFGLKGSKLVSDLMKDAKLSAVEKRRLRILLRDDDILWVIGFRPSNLFTVTDRTRQVLEIKIKPFDASSAH